MEACVFDLDGVLVDSEPVWEEVRREFVAEHGGTWQPDTQSRLMGMSTPEWAAYLHELGVAMPADQIARAVIEEMADRYRLEMPLMPGARETVRRLAAHYTLGLASSSPHALIDVVLDESGLREYFVTTVSTEEVGRGKPAPDGYLEAARRLEIYPKDCVAIEDSSNGLRSAYAAGMRVIAVPHPRYPPAPDALALAWRVLPGLDALTPDLLA
ncbi:HAD family hydrolase [Nonomuraea pusilla]|uniref:Haloacid dehalogenase superfamily, subfamily IA, variant 3 with third motif having DD or ED/haloacid dehalogenase superfamily, subfamily IA, variant 1 with third motif having Dx(3-4)D or Dx(3-4)E n=1 Tax=Nonomuraea pusilla TaxID=46177 RepID=A0A1H7ZPP9_9ACTN|nr:HAD family phosphatase [Nonomuraea pusilla]SEM60365.1 haloacid dehalogenase superfamily, subfamily IA, variant 3 with third motif having DD or ED/haloacid dehalogenase superfamily, subfamily IA, variant 1 with third motif having Dx(3-4)D or Dx(3-4)E [Nonomuraea pusilla]